MAGTNDFLPFATGGGANVESQAAYAVDPKVPTGEAPGTAVSARSNKAWRQASVWAFCLGQTIVDVLGVNAADDGNTTTLLANLKNAIASLAWTTGNARLTLATVASPGWVLVNDGSLSNAGNGGTTLASGAAQALFSLVWSSVSNTWAPVQDNAGNPVSRGGSALLDFTTNNRRIVLPKVLGRALIIAGSGFGLTARALGQILGEETHTMTTSELVAHTHTYSNLSASSIYGGGGLGAVQGYSGTNGQTTTSQGSTSAFNVMQPSSALNMEMRL